MALSRHHTSISRPLSVQEIVSQAQDFEFGTNRPLKGWLRSAQMLLTEAAICEEDGILQMAYLYLYRHAELVLGKLPQHPEYKDTKYKADVTQAQKVVAKNLAKLEQWKPRIAQDYQRYVKAMERRNAERQRIQDERMSDLRHQQTNDFDWQGSVGAEDGAFDDHEQQLNARDNRQLAVDLAHREIRRRDATRQATRQAGISPGTVASRRHGVVLDADDRNDRGVGEGVREAGRLLNDRDYRRSRTEQPSTTSSAYQYPAVPSKEDAVDWRMPALLPSSRPSARAPAIPAKETFGDGPPRGYERAPALPPKPGQRTTHSKSPSPPLGSLLPTSKYKFKPHASTESGAPLRTLLLPPSLRTTFLNHADVNTARNLETCGILCGTLISNALFINHLIIPDQTSTSDTCDTTESGDNALFDYCDANSLLVCGWIHTHPTQTCFLSSRDLHTSSGYQQMMPEAIAIVCAPRHVPEWGVFRLTDPPGLGHVLGCEQRGLFHPHGESDLYTDALKPGHVVEGPGLKFEVVDLRVK